MHAAGDLLVALSIVLGAAAVTTIVFHRLRQPVVLGYILAGVIIGPHVPVPIVASPETVRTLSELGVILLMFGLGLEFTFRKLLRAAPTAGVTAVLQASAMMWLGYVAGTALGWTTMESIFTGAVVAISSTTIIAKAFDEQRVHGALRQLVVAILIVEDLIAVLLMAVLTAVASGTGLSAGELADMIGRLGGFLVALIVLGFLIVPRSLRAIVRFGRAEITIVAAMTVCFGSALLAKEAGYSVALGAFIGGMLVAESGETGRIEPLVLPIRDMFAAVFFVSVGMMIDPAILAQHGVAIAVLAAVVIAGKIVSVAIGAFLTGNGTRTSVAAGMSLAQIGEFSFIIAGLGIALGAIGAHVYAVAVSVSAITTLTTPWLIRGSGGVGRYVDRKLPRPLQTFVAFYGSWIERIRSRHDRQSQRRRLIRSLIVDIVAVAAIALALAIGFDDLVRWLVRLGLDRDVARVVVAAAGGAILLPFCAGILVTSRRFARHLAESAVPRPEPGTLDLGAASRTMLETAIMLAGVLIAGMPLIAITQPFLSGYAGALVLLGFVLVLLLLFWRKARNLHGHVRAVAQVVLAAITAPTGSRVDAPLDVLAGLGPLERVVIAQRSQAVGRSLAQLSLRATTGATVLAILRDGHGITPPDAHDPLRPGDVLAVAGTREAIAAAVDLLAPPDRA